ncbi:uncharacterized protein LOC100378198 [Saccoglossus kowalevskii]|uniref:Uncharacterized protein LOC100378198 n=1 Tax=Saccoglossus kowalevskii TaxID=10224 RepID=A0ABM0LTU7_SACKO|nr:PREDICTED: uncharacterized protein LOC100378198 [Saccoglossus kowalevskii]
MFRDIPVFVVMVLLTTLVQMSTARHKRDNNPDLLKLGQCPTFDEGTKGVCRELCTILDDTTCPGDQKCCDNGCGHTCHEPISSQHVVKQGDCPPVAAEGAICTKECDDDGECPGRDKCCNNGCGNQCMFPLNIRPKEGRCPVFNKGGRCGVENCTHDYDCQGKKKCCNNGCGQVCADPALDVDDLDGRRPNDCPLIHVNEAILGTCFDLCKHDDHCQVGQRCCSNGCGLVCVDVLSVSNDVNQTTGLCNAGWIQHDRSCYMLEVFKHEYSLAASECVIRHPFGHLADFQDEDEFHWANNVIRNDKGFDESASIWVGLHQNDHGDWMWSDGTLLDYDLWIYGEPNFDSVCGATKQNGLLDDLCINNNRFMCEYELDNPPSIVPVLREVVDNSVQNTVVLLHQLDEAVIVVIVLAVMVALGAIIGSVIYFIKAKPSVNPIVRRRRGYDDHEKMMNDVAPDVFAL